MGRALSEVGGEIGTKGVRGEAATTGIVEQLVFADATDGEVMGVGMGDHQATYAGVWEHSTVLGQPNTNG